MNALYHKALVAADDVRMQVDASIFQPVNIYDICIELGLTVWFVNISMEGLYVKQEGGKHPTILLSCQRPFARRSFTCAHELGHHIFNHGLKVDVLESECRAPKTFNPDEYLVDLFAGSLLMPVAGLQAEVAKRNWSWKSLSPINMFTLSSIFGVGYKTIITHACANELISDFTAKSLGSCGPSQILSEIIGKARDKAHFKIFDEHTSINVVDLEVKNYIVLPKHVIIEGDHLQKLTVTPVGIAYIATRSGIVRAASTVSNFATFIRIQNYQYSGLAEYRHLEKPIDD